MDDKGHVFKWGCGCILCQQRREIGYKRAANGLECENCKILLKTIEELQLKVTRLEQESEKYRGPR